MVFYYIFAVVISILGGSNFVQASVMHSMHVNEFIYIIYMYIIIIIDVTKGRTHSKR